jgi:hypothetical protein
VATFFVSPTRLSSPTSPVRHVRRRLISTTRLTRREATKSTSINKETDVDTPVLKIMMLVAANMPIQAAGIIRIERGEKGIVSVRYAAVAFAACIVRELAIISQLHSKNLRRQKKYILNIKYRDRNSHLTEALCVISSLFGSIHHP